MNSPRIYLKQHESGLAFWCINDPARVKNWRNRTLREKINAKLAVQFCCALNERRRMDHAKRTDKRFREIIEMGNEIK